MPDGAKTTKYFVMLVDGDERKGPLPMVDEDEHIALYDTTKEAHEVASRNILGKAYGFEVYPWCV